VRYANGQARNMRLHSAFLRVSLPRFVVVCYVAVSYVAVSRGRYRPSASVVRGGHAIFKRLHRPPASPLLAPARMPANPSPQDNRNRLYPKPVVTGTSPPPAYECNPRSQWWANAVRRTLFLVHNQYSGNQPVPWFITSSVRSLVRNPTGTKGLDMPRGTPRVREASTFAGILEPYWPRLLTRKSRPPQGHGHNAYKKDRSCTAKNLIDLFGPVKRGLDVKGEI
jgi:hypothetical protein